MRSAFTEGQRLFDLASVREEKSLEDLPADEREEWRQLWAEVREALKALADSLRAEVNADGIRVSGDPGAIEQILINLVENAAEVTGRRGEVGKILKKKAARKKTKARAAERRQRLGQFQLATGEGADEQQQRRAGEVEVGDEGVHHPEVVAGDDDEIEVLLARRQQARRTRDFAAADAIRDQLHNLDRSIQEKYQDVNELGN